MPFEIINKDAVNMIKVMLTSEVETLSGMIEPRVITHIQNGQVNKFECHDKVNLMAFDRYAIRDILAVPSQIVIVFTNEHLIFLCEEEQGAELVRSLLQTENPHDKVLFEFFVELIRNDIDVLEEMEEHISETEDALLTNNRSAVIREIRILRKRLLSLRKYYEQLNQIFEGLMENENELISKADLRYFRILNSKIDRLYSNVLNLRDYVTQIREAYQAQIDIEQNNLMRIFTVVTAIFMPLTLIVGWYGMNLRMPELTWSFTYPLVIVLSIAVVVFCIIYFKRKKWF
jgi:magnesium transporter